MCPPLSYIVWDVNSDIFTIPFLDHPVRWYGVTWALGFILSQQVMYYIYKKENRPASEVDTLTVYMLIAAICGARLGHVLFYDPIEYLSNPLSILYVWEGGLASHGGAIAVLFALYLFARKTSVRYFWIVDRLVIVSALTGAFIRFGNLMNSEMVGLPTNLPWGFIFTSVDAQPRHPAQLYESLYCLILFIVLFALWYKRHTIQYNGTLTAYFLITLFSLRILDESLKINQVAFEDGMLLNMGQILSIPFVLIGIVILVMKKRFGVGAPLEPSSVETAS